MLLVLYVVRCKDKYCLGLYLFSTLFWSVLSSVGGFGFSSSGCFWCCLLFFLNGILRATSQAKPSSKSTYFLMYPRPTAYSLILSNFPQLHIFVAASCFHWLMQFCPIRGSVSKHSWIGKIFTSYSVLVIGQAKNDIFLSCFTWKKKMFCYRFFNWMQWKLPCIHWNGAVGISIYE